jgi:predicted nucleic acid-binding protein
MQAFDASSIIYGWDNYPIQQFPKLWNWMATQIQDKEIAMSVVAVSEVQGKTPDCCTWLKDNDLEQWPVGNNEIQEALRIKDLLGIVGDQYHVNGVGENDIIIISTCRLRGVGLVSDEKRQQVAPSIPAKRKIPSVCGMPTVGVACSNFLDFIKQSGEVFG